MSSEIDKLIHQPVRLKIMSALSSAEKIEFAALRDIVGVSDSLLSRQLKILEQANYVSSTKGYFKNRPRTWLAITEQGQATFSAYIKTLNMLIGSGQ